MSDEKSQKERRRYFRIDETVGIAYHVVEGDVSQNDKVSKQAPDILDLVSKQDRQIEKLLVEISEENPKVAELVTVFNQKLERIVSQMVMESHLVGRIAHKIREANISACGIAFDNDEEVSLGARLRLELTLYPSEEHVIMGGIVVACDKIRGKNKWYWRIDFYDMSDSVQERLIQHIVQCQSQQLKAKRMSN